MKKYAIALVAMGLMCSWTLAEEPGAAGANATASNAQQIDQDFRTAYMSADTPEKLFVLCAAAQGHCEMQGAKMALAKSQDPQVKQLAQKIWDDHQAADQRLQKVAAALGVTLPKGEGSFGEHARQVYEKLNGKEFDQQYVSWVRATHAQAVSECQDIAQLSKNPLIKDYAQQTLPALQQHYQQSQQAALALGLSSGIEAQPAGARLQGNDAGRSPEMPKQNQP